jgi:hypothetical protein
VIRSQDDNQGQLEILKKVILTLQQGERHRLVGLEEWGVVAEIWQHTDAENLDENDIVRVKR